MSEQPEEGRDGAEKARASGLAGSKRRARPSVTSALVSSSEITESSALPIESPLSQAIVTDHASSSNLPTLERPKRASRVLSHIRDGFRRTGSTKNVTALASGSQLARNPIASTQGMASRNVPPNVDITTSAVVTDTQIPDNMQRRQDKKRRRIGEYAGPSNGSGSEGISASSSEIAPTPVKGSHSALEATPQSSSESVSFPPQQDISSDTEPSPLLSPPVVPLTDSDPLLDDRLRSLEAIRSVLGDEVARRLPSVESLRELSQSQAVPGMAMQSGAPAASADADPTVDCRERRHSRISLPASTVELLNELDRPTGPSAVADETAIVTSSAQTPTHETSQWTGSGSDASTTAAQRERRTRRSSLRNFTNRIGGWLGVGPTRNETGAAGSGQMAEAAMDMDVEDAPVDNPLSATVEEDVQVDNADASTQAEPTASANRLATGAVMIVQGFVQTTVPARERRRSGPTAANHSQTDLQPTFTQSGMRRSMSHPSTSTAPSTGPTTLSNAVRSPHSSHPAPPVPETRPLPEGGLRSRHTSPPVTAPTSASPNNDESRSSDTNVTPDQAEQSGDRQGAAPGARPEPPTFAEQARMLGGLLSVATAATATSLLNQGTQTTSTTDTPALASTPHTWASGPRAALEALRNRLRPSGNTDSSTNTQTSHGGTARAPVPDQGVEDVLREYMRHAMSSSRNASTLSDTNGSLGPMLSTILPTTDPASFEAFLNDMQTSLIQALSTYAEESDVGDERGGDIEEQDPEATGTISSTATDASVSRNQTAARPQVSRAASGLQEPRRLNFFRSFQFPARQNPPAEPSDPIVDLIPVVIVGVRSMNRDINTVTAENVAAAPFPFNHTDNIQGAPDNQTMESTEAMGATNATEDVSEPRPRPTPAVPELTRPSQERTGSWSSRALRSINRLRRPRAGIANVEASDADDESTRNYVLWVVGGNYPAGHPILTLPHLFTGELSHDDLWTLAEALGQVKPPVASRTDIENSGLAIIKGRHVKDEAASGAILASCMEQCLICLAEYEDEDESEVRVMQCKHAYHKDCIDHWLEVGRNSCPACRQAGVRTASGRDAQPLPTEAPSASAPEEDVNMTS